MKNEIVLFTDGDVNIEVQINPEQETVWLTQKQMEALFEVKRTTVSKHISNILASGELDETSVGFSDRSTGGRKPKIYNLDMILSVGYRVNSKRGIAFRKWANNVLKQFILKGYAINEKRLQALKKTVDIQSRMLADALDIEEKDVLRAVNEYTDALILLDQYDHQTLSKPEGSTPVYRITYEECVQMVGQMKDSFETDVFGVEKEDGKVQGIIAAVYQSVFGQDAYPSLEEKAANLLYFMIKDHPYADGCKRIAASLFLEFLDKNNALFLDGEKRLSDGTLVAITLMIAESKPEEKDVMDRLDSAFRNCEKLQNHVRLLLDKGGLYKTYNGNLLFHGSIPLNEDGSLKEVQIYGKTYKGKELYDVLETYVRKVDKLVHLTINGEEIVTTDNHPFYVQGRGFINAGSLLVGDKLISVNGEDLFVEKHYIEETDVPVDVYNFQVEDHHTYFVGESAVWVHNNNKACPVPEPRKSEKHKTADGEPLTYKSNSKHTPGH